MTSSPASGTQPVMRDARPTTPLPVWVCGLVGGGFAVAGLLPWLATGLRLPLQNLWAVETRPEAMPRVLLPFNQYTIVLIIAVLVTGAVAAGVWARASRRRLPERGVRAVAGGVLTVQLVAVLQTTAVVHAGLTARRASTVYLVGLVLVAVLSVVVGVLALALVGAAPPAGAVVGLCVGALASGPWVTGLVLPYDAVAPSALRLQVLTVVRWAPPVLVGAAVAWGGLRSVGRVVAAVVGLVLLWVVPALTAALANAVGSRVLARYPAEMVRYGVEVLGAALSTPALVLPPVLVAVLVATAGLAGRAVLRRSRRVADVAG